MVTVSQFRGRLHASYSLKFKGKGYNFHDNLDNVPLESTPSSGKGGFERQLMSIHDLLLILL